MTSAAKRVRAISEGRSAGSDALHIGSAEFGHTRASLRNDAIDNLERWRIALSRSDTVRVAELVQRAHAIREAIHLINSSHGIPER